MVEKNNESKSNTVSENKENEYLEQMQRIQAEFENFRKKT